MKWKWPSRVQRINNCDHADISLLCQQTIDDLVSKFLSTPKISLVLLTLFALLRDSTDHPPAAVRERCDNVPWIEYYILHGGHWTEEAAAAAATCSNNKQSISPPDRQTFASTNRQPPPQQQSIHPFIHPSNSNSRPWWWKSRLIFDWENDYGNSFVPQFCSKRA